MRLRIDAAKRYRVTGATVLIWQVMMVAEQHFLCLDSAELLPAAYAGQQYQDGKPIKMHPSIQGKEAA